MAESVVSIEKTVATTPKTKLIRCMEWLQNQNDLKKFPLENKHDKQFIAQRCKLSSTAEDEVTVPDGVDEPGNKPKAVPLHYLRVKDLHMECEWQSCRCHFSDYELFQTHVANHSSELHVIDIKGNVDYVCLWDVCGHSTSDYTEMLRHINYHAYHARLLAIGYNGRATLKLTQCRKDSSKRNLLPPLKHSHCCMWVGCTQSYNSIQAFFNHVKLHVTFSGNSHLCSWAGCGVVFPRRSLLTLHVRSHTRERLIACYHCGNHFACNRKLSDHLMRQNVDSDRGIACSMCGILCATQYLKREHERQHISAYACAMCDMSAPTPAALAHHMRYRHLPSSDTRTHACPHCPYRAVTKSDLRKHIPIHLRKKKRKRAKDDVIELSDEDSSEEEIKKKIKIVKKYACHMCPDKEVKVFSRGTRLTTHLVKVHGAQWPFGHSRFRYQISEDGMYRLTTTRFEYEDISKKIVDGYSGPKESFNNTFEFDVKQIADATETTPEKFEISLKNNNLNEDVTSEKANVTSEKANVKSVKGNVKSVKGNEKSELNQIEHNAVEIMMCDVDDEGNIINSETIESCDLLV